jgi:ribosomal protein S18 acetylase RimI-like enzyme
MPQPPTGQALLQPAQVEHAARLLGKAFQDDPLMAYIAPSAARRRRTLPAFFRVAVRYCLRYGTVYTTEELDGVACCLPPGQTEPSVSRLLRVVLSGALWLPGPLELRRALHATTYTDEAHARTAPGPHWYLWVLGVEPEKQGLGIGGRLLQSVIQQAREQGVPCYLETENPRNVPFYQKHGFRLVREVAIAKSDVRIYALLWEAGADS